MSPATVDAPRYYVDTSAYLAILLGEDGSEELVRELAGGALCSSVLLVLETTRNLIRFSRAGVLAPELLQEGLDRLTQDIECFALRELTLDLCAGTVVPPVTTPRSLDLAHVRTALWFHGQAPLERFVSMDASQTLTARELGLPV